MPSTPGACWSTISATGSEGYFANPSQPGGSDLSCLGESVVRVANKGAIASWSPTGQGLAAGHDFLDRGLFQALFYHGMHEIGAAATQAKLYLYGNTGEYRDLLDTYVLFGDPALQLNAPWTQYLPIVTKNPAP
jgi:hypothetical protein